MTIHISSFTSYDHPHIILYKLLPSPYHHLQVMTIHILSFTSYDPPHIILYKLRPSPYHHLPVMTIHISSFTSYDHPHIILYQLWPYPYNPLQVMTIPIPSFTSYDHSHIILYKLRPFPYHPLQVMTIPISNSKPTSSGRFPVVLTYAFSIYRRVESNPILSPLDTDLSKCAIAIPKRLIVTILSLHTIAVCSLPAVLTFT